MNPSHLVPPYSYNIAHQKLGFVTQRRVVDKWGRMMLLKPNRKYFAGASKVLFDYHAHDYMDKMLALSMLRDQDYDDLVIPENQYDNLLQASNNPPPTQNQNKPAAASQAPDSPVKSPTKRCETENLNLVTSTDSFMVEITTDETS